MKCKNVIGLSIIIGLSLFGVVGASIFFFINTPSGWLNVISFWIGIVGTLSSVILSVLAMIYSNKSSKETEDSLKQIRQQYKDLCEDIRKNKLRTGEQGIDNFISEEQKIYGE